MQQISISQLSCPHCGHKNNEGQPVCEECGAPMNEEEAAFAADDTRKTFPLYAHEDDTVRVDPGDFDKTVRISNYNSDPDATVKGVSRLSSSLYLRAAEQAALQNAALDEDEDTQVKLPRAPKAPVARKQVSSRKRFIIAGSALGLVLILLLAAAGIVDHVSNRSTEQQAFQNKALLDQMITQARAEGISAKALQPVVGKEQQLSAFTPVTLFHNPLATSYYRDHAQQYQQMQKQVQTITATQTQQLQTQAQRDMQNFQAALSEANLQAVGNMNAFANQFSQDQLLLESAQTPKEYTTISNNARTTISALSLLKSTYQQLTDFGNTLNKIKSSHIDVSGMQTQYQSDVKMFDKALQPQDFENLNVQLNAQYQQISVESLQAFPYISVTKLNEFRSQIQSLHTYGYNTSSYEQKLSSDQVASQNAATITDQLSVMKQIDTDIGSMKGNLVHGQAIYLVKQFHQEVTSWGNAHPYHDSYDGHNYALNSGYSNTGIGKTLDSDLAAAVTQTDYESVITEAQSDLFNEKLLEADSSDHTSMNQVHATDTQLLDHYKLQQKQVLVVSLAEQAMRVYQNGKLVYAAQVTTGRSERPSLPGIWTVLQRTSPAIFKSGDPKGSPYWFPDTPISYAILYHYGGFFVHDAPWRVNFGPGTQFPHNDAGGTTAYNFDGSHGCINLTSNAAGWVYHHTGWNTTIAVY